MIYDIMIALNIITALVLMFFVAKHPALTSLNLATRLGIWVGAVGLLLQASRTLHVAIYGIELPETGFPTWVLKDVGYWVMALGWGLNYRYLRANGAKVSA